MRVPARLAVALVLFAVGCSGLTMYSPQLRGYDVEGKFLGLPGGLRVFFEAGSNDPSVMVTTLIGVGSAVDPQGKEGLAHLVEHLWFRARHDNGQTIKNRIRALGGTCNASTGYDDTTFYTIAPRGVLDTVLEIESERFDDPLAGISDEVFQVEREVVRNELRQYNETTISMRALDTLAEMLFPAGHPYHRPTIGTQPSLDGLTLADAQSFAAAWYKPQVATIVVTGKVGDDPRALLVRSFRTYLEKRAGLQTQPAREPPLAAVVTEPPETPERSIRHIQGTVTRPQVYLGWSLPAAYRDNDWLQGAAVDMAQLFMSHALRDPLRGGTVYGLGCKVEPARMHSLAVCSFAVGDGTNAEELARRAAEAVWQLWDAGDAKWHASMLKRWKAASVTVTLDSAAGISRGISIAPVLHYTGNPSAFAQLLSQIVQTQEPGLRRFALKYLNSSRVATLVVDPEGPTPAVPPSPAAVAIDAAEDKELEEVLMGKDTSAVPGLITAPTSAELRELTLENGLHVILQPYGKAPLVRAAVVTGGGNLTSVPMGLPELVIENDSARDPVETTGYWFDQDLADAQLRGVSMPAGNLAAAIDLIATRIETTHCQWRSTVFAEVVADARRYYEALARDPEVVLERNQLARVFPKDPIAGERDFGALSKLGERQLDAWVESTIAPANASLILVGDFRMQEAERLVRERLSDWRQRKPGVRMAGAPATNPPLPREVLLVDRPSVAQSSLRLMCALSPARAEDEAARRVAVTLIENHLLKMLREELGASYGVEVTAQDFRGGRSYMKVQSTLASDLLVRAITAALSSIDDIAHGRTRDAELRGAKWAAAGATHAEGTGLGQVLDRLVRLERIGLPITTMTDYPSQLAAVSAADLERILAPCVGNESIGILGPAALVTPQLQAAGLTPTPVAADAK